MEENPLGCFVAGFMALKRQLAISFGAIEDKGDWWVAALTHSRHRRHKHDFVLLGKFTEPTDEI